MVEFSRARRAAHACIAAAIGLHLSWATAQSSPSRDPLSKPFVYKASEKKLAEVLQDFAASQSIPVVLADGIEGSLTGSFDLGGRSFLKLMADSYGLSWYYDGAALFIYPVKALQSKLFYLSGTEVDNIRRTLSSLGLEDKRFPLRHASDVGVLFAFGPPRYIELISAVASSMQAHARDPARLDVRVFTLKHAHAGDRTSGGVKRTGVARLLSRIYGTEGAEFAGGALSGLSRAKTWPSLVSKISGEDEASARSTVRKAGDAALGLAERTMLTGAMASTPASMDKVLFDVPAEGKTPSPLFEADEARNSVIVRGPPDHFAQIESLIRQFDVAQDLIELEAVIIDINQSDVRDLGLQWEAFARDTSVGYGDPITAIANGGGFSLTRLAGGSSLQFMARINALESKGRARIIARPRVLGIANQPAVMKDSRTASVRVSGNLSTSLHQVEAGTRIEMLARRVGPAEDKKLLLSLSIQDGAFDEQQVDSVPVVRQTEIHTETYVDEGEGLLIGGISTERSTASDSGVPGLSSLPLIGALFSSERRLEGGSERLFLIVPRTIGTQWLAAKESQEIAP